MSAEHLVAVDYVNGRMSPAERTQAEAHIADCGQCQAAVRAVEQAQAVQQTNETSIALTNFVFRIWQGSASMVAPLLRQVSFNSTQKTDEPEKLPVFEPLRVLQPRVVRTAKRFVGRFGLVLVLTVAVLLLPTPAGLSPEGHRALAVFVFTGSILALEPVSLPIAALMVPVAQVALGVAKTPQAFETFSRPVVFLILASLFMAEALRKHGLTRRLALTTIVASGGGIPMLVLGMMSIAALLSMWVENTATAAVLIPVALTIAKQLPDPKKARQLLVLLVLGIAYAASLGGMVTIMGSASNAVAAGFLAQVRPWSFVDWMVYGLPAFLLIFPLTWWLLLRLVKAPVESLDVEPVRKKFNELGAMNGSQREILGTFLVGVVLWVGGSFIEPWLGLPETLLSSAMVAVLIVSYLAIRGIINWEDVKGVSWGIFLIIGAGLSLGETLSRTGVTDWFAELIIPMVKGPPLLVSMMLLVFLSAVLTNIMNNTTIAAVFVPILITLASSDPAFNAVQLVLPVTLATTFGYSLPSASGRMSLIAASGIVNRSEMMRYGLIMTLVSSLVLGFFFYVLTLLNWI
ncbi:MAG: DASS family sodium-coupled anion symporter [Anaerolineales bacterium]|nr:DASS family sodium-coupled anion symporter [Anaerolineales bacterium]